MLCVYVIKVSQTLSNHKISVKSLKAQTSNFCFLCSIVLVIEKQKDTWFLSIFCQGCCCLFYSIYSSQDAEAFLFCSNFFRKHKKRLVRFSSDKKNYSQWGMLEKFSNTLHQAKIVRVDSETKLLHLMGEKFSELCFDAFSINYRAIRSKLKCLSI